MVADAISKSLEYELQRRQLLPDEIPAQPQAVPEPGRSQFTLKQVGQLHEDS